MANWKWLEDRVETSAGGAYRFGAVGQMELAHILEELKIRGEAWAILSRAKAAFADGVADYADAAQRIPTLLREKSKVRDLLEEVFGWIDLCFDGRTPIAELPEEEKLAFAVEAVDALAQWRVRKEEKRAQAQTIGGIPMPAAFAEAKPAQEVPVQG